MTDAQRQQAYASQFASHVRGLTGDLSFMIADLRAQLDVGVFEKQELSAQLAASEAKVEALTKELASRRRTPPPPAPPE